MLNYADRVVDTTTTTNLPRYGKKSTSVGRSIKRIVNGHPAFEPLTQHGFIKSIFSCPLRQMFCFSVISDKDTVESVRWRDRHSQSHLYRPTIINTGLQTNTSHSNPTRPSGQTHRHTIISNPSGFSCISRLIIHCYPFTIFRTIRAIIINTFNRVFRTWSFAHVGKKILERCSPTITDINSSTPVRLKLRTINGITSLFHPLPCIIFLSVCATVRCISVFFHNTYYSNYSYRGTD